MPDRSSMSSWMVVGGTQNYARATVRFYLEQRAVCHHGVQDDVLICLV
jgi:hypothetical protein